MGSRFFEMLVATACVLLVFGSEAWADDAPDAEDDLGAEDVESTTDDSTPEPEDRQSDVDDEPTAEPEGPPDGDSSQALTDDDSSQALRRIVVDDPGEEPERGELDANQRQELTEHLQAAMTAEEDERYEEARKRYIQAYDIYPHSNLLLGIARTSLHLDDEETARDGYQTFLTRQPEYDNREEIEARIEELEASLEEDDVAEPVEPTEEASGSSLPSKVGWAGLGGVFLGTVSLITAGAISSSVDGQFDELEAAVEDGDRDASLLQARDIGRRQAHGRFFLYGGVTLVVVGATMVVVDYAVLDRPPLVGGTSTEETSANSSLRPAPSVAADDDSILLQWTGTF